MPRLKLIQVEIEAAVILKMDIKYALWLRNNMQNARYAGEAEGDKKMRETFFEAIDLSIKLGDLS